MELTFCLHVCKKSTSCQDWWVYIYYNCLFLSISNMKSILDWRRLETTQSLAFGSTLSRKILSTLTWMRISLSLVRSKLFYSKNFISNLSSPKKLFTKILRQSVRRKRRSFGPSLRSQLFTGLEHLLFGDQDFCHQQSHGKARHALCFQTNQVNHSVTVFQYKWVLRLALQMHQKESCFYDS